MQGIKKVSCHDSLAKWLEQNEIMDYSLLIGIQNPRSESAKSVDESSNKPLTKVKSHVYFCEDVKTVKTRSGTLRQSRSRSQAMIDRRGTDTERKE